MSAEQILDEIKGAEGTVKWFDPRKGFGFIVGPSGQDIFTHFSVIEGDGFRALKDGAAVSYDAVRTEKGWRATQVAKAEAQIEAKAASGARLLSQPRSPRR